MACTSDQTGRLYIKQHPGDAQLSLDELRDMVGREGQTISNCVFSVSEYQNFPNSYLLFTMVSMHLSINGRVRSTQTLVIHQWAGPSVIAELAPDSTPDRAE